MRENVPLREFTTLRVGGPARYFFVARTIEDVEKAVLFAGEISLPIFVFGGGSNILVSDKGFNGVVIKLEIGGIVYEEMNGDRVRVTAGAGVVWDDLVKETVERGLWGMENLSLIPGTVGAAPVQNINAYGTDVSDIITEVYVFDADTMSKRVFPAEQCAFSYRSSVFKTRKNLIITQVRFVLSRNGIPDFSYKDLEKYFARKKITSQTIIQMRDAVVAIRSGKLPDPKKVRTAGSFFMHPIVSRHVGEDLAKRMTNLLLVPYIDGTVKIIAGRLLDELKWKGVRKGRVGTHPTHALTVVNHGSGNAREIFDFSEQMIADVKMKTGITLEREVQTVGDFA